MSRVNAAALHERLSGKDEIALLDVREQGVHYRGHPFFAASLPLSRIEMMIGDLVPRRGVPLVLMDGGGGEVLAERAAGKTRALGYTGVAVLEDGLAGWRKAGFETFSGVNVPSKAFGEYVEHRFGTPHISAADLKTLQERGADLVILDSRPFEEYRRMSIPGGIDVPGAELAWRVHDAAPRRETIIVVNCAGRTRSIVGAQALINASVPNRVMALKDGTMGWELAGLELERGQARAAAAPSEDGRRKAQSAADRVARRFGVRFATRDEAQAWQADSTRTTYWFDVRPPEEFAALHIRGSRHAPGGQLMQATDDYAAVRNARIVLIDPERVRAIMTASWLIQLGWSEVRVLLPEGENGFAGWPTASGAWQPERLDFQAAATIAPAELAPQLDRCAVLDLSTSLNYRHGHIDGAWWGVRSRLADARTHLPPRDKVVLVSEDGVLAHYAAPETARLWTRGEVLVMAGGMKAWRDADLPEKSGLSRLTTTTDDVWYKPYDYEGDVQKHMRDYLGWETALLEQIKRDPSIRFPILQ